MLDFFYTGAEFSTGPASVSLDTPLPDVSMFETQTRNINLDSYFSNAASYEVITGPAWGTVAAGVLTITAPTGSATSSPFSITVRATGEDASTAQDTLVVTVSASVAGGQPYSAWLHGDAPRSSTVAGHKFWCWDDPHGLATSHPDIHIMERQVINENATTRWKANLPGLGTHDAVLVSRNGSVTTGDATVSIPVREAQDYAVGVLAKGLARGEVGLMIQNFGSPSIEESYPFHNVVFRNVLDAPIGVSGDGTNPITLVNNVDNNGDLIVSVDPATDVSNAPAGYNDESDGIDSFFTKNGVDYWSGWMTAFCNEWQRLQRVDPGFTTLPDITAFWFDTENGLRMNNIIKNWSAMLEDPRATDPTAIVGSPWTLAQIHQKIKDALDPSDWLPEDGGGNLLDTSGYSWLNAAYIPWVAEAVKWQNKIESWAFKAITDDEILPLMPSVYIANWNTSSDYPVRIGDMNSVVAESGDIQVLGAKHGTHAGDVFYSSPLQNLDYTFQDTTNPLPLAPWVFGPLRWAATVDVDDDSSSLTPDVAYYDNISWWRLADDTWDQSSSAELPADLQSKYASLLSGNIHERQVGCAEIYWREAMTTLADMGCRHFLLWWNPANESGISGAPADYRDDFGDMLANLYDESFSNTPTVPLAKYLKTSITRAASGIPHWKIQNGIKSWTLKMDSNSNCILKINGGTYIGTYRHPEWALQILVALHLRLGARAFSDAEQRALKSLIDSKYVKEPGV